MSELSELFARDPLNLTTSDLDQIIERYRQARAQFNLGLKVDPAVPKAKKPKPAKITNLDDILGDY